ncbi:MAG: hypothetical protein AB7I59_11800 [Geminicoccaceae bacterium]
MKVLMATGVLFVAAVSAATAQSLPDLKGTWSGPFKTAIFGHNPHHPGTGTIGDAPRIREIDFSLDIQGQDGPLLWGHSWSNPETKEPFAMSVTADGKTIIGADGDGSLSASITTPDQLDLCYTHTALSPSQSIVASCGVLKRTK